MIFSLTIDRIIKKRVQLALGRRKYTLEHHVVLCGLGRLGYFIAEALLERGEKLLIIEQSEQTAAVEHFRRRGAAVYIGDARALGVLQDVAIAEAKALFAVISNDYVNLEIGLNARSLKPDLRLVLRVFDHSMAEMIKENLDIHLTFSMSAIVDQQFLGSAGLASASASRRRRRNRTNSSSHYRRRCHCCCRCCCCRPRRSTSIRSTTRSPHRRRSRRRRIPQPCCRQSDYR